jgi:hypothetical protein
VVNRGFRSGSAPTPTPLNKQSTNNYYIRRPTVVFNDERNGPSDKSSGAQAKVNQKFVNFNFQKTLFHRNQTLLFRLDINPSTEFVY